MTKTLTRSNTSVNAKLTWHYLIHPPDDWCKSVDQSVGSMNLRHLDGRKSIFFSFCPFLTKFFLSKIFAKLFRCDQEERDIYLPIISNINQRQNHRIPTTLSVSMSVEKSCLFVSFSACLSVCPHSESSVCLSVHPPRCLSVHPPSVPTFKYIYK